MQLSPTTRRWYGMVLRVDASRALVLYAPDAAELAAQQRAKNLRARARDSELAHQFEYNERTFLEWIYRGSLHLKPLFNVIVRSPFILVFRLLPLSSSWEIPSQLLFSSVL